MNYKSQWQQDRYLNENIFKGKMYGTFVDVGAHDGVSGSNTYFFEKELGWTGLCIEPITDRYVELTKTRDCICMNCCVYNKPGTVSFTQNTGYTEMLSGITTCQDPRHLTRADSERKIHGGDLTIVRKQAYTLSSLLDLNNITEVDYLSVDVEGAELEVLQGINFRRHKIHVIGIENNYPDTFQRVDTLLKKNGYEKITTLGGDEIYTI